MYELRPYQKRAIEEIRQAIKDGFHSIMIQAPTGAGKGVILSHIINSANNKGSKVLFLVHRAEILFQISAYMDKYEITHGIIKAGFEADYTIPVQLASFQTIHRRMKFYQEEFDLVIIDEAHHGTAKTYLEVIEAFRKKLILGFSATPTRQNGMGLGNVFDKLVSVATIQDLTDMGFLAPIRYFAPVQPDLSGVKLTAGDYNAKQLEPAMMDGHLIGDMFEHWLKYGEDRKTVIFATGVAHSIAIKDRFNAAEIPTCHIDGTTPKEDRDEVLSRFKRGDIKIIVNCQILTEGVDVPDVGCVVLARPTKSLVMYMQMVGRGMRVIEGKTDLILIDHAGACYEHGFVHEITEWELSETKQTTNKENEKRKKKESRPITCPMCSCTYSKRLKCPECGNIPERAQFGKEVDHIDGVLGEICFKSKAAKIKKVASSDKESWFSQLKTYAKHRGYSPGWAAHAFRDKFGVWPNKYKDAPLIPFDFISLEVLDYIKYKRIRLAKSKDKAHVSV